MENSHPTKETVHHPLDPLNAEEVRTAVRILRTHRPSKNNLRFVSVNLQEPAKTEFERMSSGEIVDRRAFVIVIDLTARCVLEALVSLREAALVRRASRRSAWHHRRRIHHVRKRREGRPSMARRAFAPRYQRIR
jgi:Cu2+-containing amine oxidase